TLTAPLLAVFGRTGHFRSGRRLPSSDSGCQRDGNVRMPPCHLGGSRCLDVLQHGGLDRPHASRSHQDPTGRGLSGYAQEFRQVACPPLEVGNLTPGDGVPVRPQENAGAADQSSAPLKSTSPPENSAPVKLTVPPENPARSKLTVPPENSAA